MDNLTLSVIQLNDTIVSVNSFYSSWFSFFLGFFVGVLALHGLIKYA